MKAPLLAGIAFAVGLAGSTGVVVLRGNGAPPSVAPADSAHGTGAADSSARTTAGHADTAAAPPDSLTVHEAAPPPVSTPPAGAHAESPVAPVAVPRAPELPPTAAPAPQFARLAKILGAMPVPKATELLAFMTDTEVEGILRSFGARQAAGLLAALPKERAAKIGRRLLLPSDSSAAP
ncbi:MAG: hypothetical protein HOP28_06705 [Gemmatimonadales bacterium]|nr:hypothetical protein [Gemmatimonadales bacterium]